ncbi:MAG: signal peptidase II [Alphaproteobacteria bacterium]|nr:signal peptidase II [Alphaproteobacteria bacterium]
MTAPGRGTATLVALAVLVLDQATKWWILERVMQPPRVIEVTPFFNLVLVWNRGVSFGILNNASPYNSIVLATLSLIVAAGLGVWAWRARQALVRLALGGIIGGAVGNAIDRLRHDGVVDFLDVHAFALHWPAFNVADAAITVGAALMVWDALFPGPDSIKNAG